MKKKKKLPTPMPDRVKDLADKWIRQGVPKLEEFHGLSPDEARAVAYYAGYNTNHELHVRVREGCARAAVHRLT